MIGNKKILSIITARAGSVGVKNKNFKELLGKPLFIWSVLASLQSEYVDITVISSNCSECKKIYLEFISTLNKEQIKKIYWIERPDKYSTSTSKNEEALIYSYNKMLITGFSTDIIINLQPTSPCRTNNFLDKCILEYYNSGSDSLLTGRKETPFIWQKKNKEWIYTVDKNNCCNRKMRQELLEEDFIYHDDGNLYITDVNVLINTGCRVGKKPIFVETDSVQSLQIDEPDDFLLIEKMVEVKNLKTLI
jgi:CMP-N-acetylneuraminic acid synthetase